MKKFLNKPIGYLMFALMLATCVVAVFSINTAAPAYAYSDENYIQAGMNFLQEQYEGRGVTYDSLEIAESVPLYDETDSVIAKCLIVDRDGEYDYAVLDFIIDRIDEFGFNQNELLGKFTTANKVYYAGYMSYAVKDGDNFYDLDGIELDGDEFLASVAAFKAYAIESVSQVDNAVSDPNAGIISWGTITSRNSSYSNSDWNYLSGVNWNGLTGSGLSFHNQTVLNAAYNASHGTSINGTCGPVALTNMYAYFQWRGITNKSGNVNALKNGSINDTFSRLMTLSGWNNGTTINDYLPALRNFASEQNYNYDSNSYLLGTSWNTFKTSIDHGRPAIASIHVDTNSGDWGHAVLVLGYEQFTHTYQVNERYWLFGWHDNWKTKTDNYRYLRAIDGWSTANSSRFIDYNGFFTVKGVDFKVKG